MRILFILFIFLVSGCQKNNDNQDFCYGNFLYDIEFNTGNFINTNLPQYSSLQFPGNVITLNGFGIQGVVVYNSGSGVFAYELAEPGENPSECSALEIVGIEAKSTCDTEREYNLLTGLQSSGEGSFCLKRYLVESSGSIIRVYN